MISVIALIMELLVPEFQVEELVFVDVSDPPLVTPMAMELVMVIPLD
jgi:hypothetical protein